MPCSRCLIPRTNPPELVHRPTSHHARFRKALALIDSSPMKNITSKLVTIGLLVGICLFAVYPPHEEDSAWQGSPGRGQPGLLREDRGRVPSPTRSSPRPSTSSSSASTPRASSTSACNPVGRDRIEVVMPLPNDQVRALQQTYRDSRWTRFSRSRGSAPASSTPRSTPAMLPQKYGGTSRAQGRARPAPSRLGSSQGRAGRSRRRASRATRSTRFE